MMKYMCICLCAIGAVSAKSYGSGYGAGAPVGAYAYQVQPALTVKAIVPAYGGGYGGQHGGYGGNAYTAAPVASVYSGADGYSGSGYGGAPAVDSQAIALAKLALAAPSAGSPLSWKEAPSHIQPVYPPISYGPQVYGGAEKVKGGSAAAAASSVAAGQKAQWKPSY